MKNLFKAALLAVGLFITVQGHAQTTGQKIDRAATKVGHKTSEVAANTAAVVADKKYAGKSGPQGQTVYINKYSHYYYISKTGHKIYVPKSALLNKPGN